MANKLVFHTRTALAKNLNVVLAIPSWVLIAALLTATPAQAGAIGRTVKKNLAIAAGVAAGAAVANKISKAKHRGPDDGLGPGDYDSGSEAQDHVSLKEKASLVLQKATTKALRKNLAANGEQPAKGCAAHHIVPKGENRDWARRDVNDARDVLDSCGIGMDDSMNGVYLPYGENAQCKGADHNKLHNKLYYATLNMLLQSARGNGCDEVKRQLASIKESLKQNIFNGAI